MQQLLHGYVLCLFPFFLFFVKLCSVFNVLWLIMISVMTGVGMSVDSMSGNAGDRSREPLKVLVYVYLLNPSIDISGVEREWEQIEL